MITITSDTFKNEFFKNLDENGVTLAAEEKTKIEEALKTTTYNCTIIKEVTKVDYSSAPTIIESYLNTKELEGYSKITIKNYRYTLVPFLKFVAKDVDKITTEDIRIYLFSYKKIGKISDRSLEGVRVKIGAFLEWCKDEEFISKNPCRKIAPIKYERKERDYMTQEELEIFRCKANTLKEKLIVELLYSTGCRVSELCLMKVADVDLADCKIKIFGKGKKNRTVFISPKTKVLLNEWLKKRDYDSEYIIYNTYAPDEKVSTRTIERLIKELSDAAYSEINKIITPHILRHTFASLMLQSGMDINMIQTLLGHENINTTLIYAKSTTSDIAHEYNKRI